jgi:hypothetical protein
VELPLTTPSPDHIEFDDMCSEVEEFETLPSVAGAPLDAEPEVEEESSLASFDGQILAGLVSPC